MRRGGGRRGLPCTERRRSKGMSREAVDTAMAGGCQSNPGTQGPPGLSRDIRRFLINKIAIYKPLKAFLNADLQLQ